MGLNTTTVLLIVHGLLAVALLGAITHQALSVWVPARKPASTFVARFRAVPGASYVNAVIVLYLLTAVLGGIIYATYRIEVRFAVEQMGLWKAFGMFELKEHFTAIGFAVLPAYWYHWQAPLQGQHARPRAILTALLAFIVWWSFLTGHILNNIRGFGG